MDVSRGPVEPPTPLALSSALPFASGIPAMCVRLSMCRRDCIAMSLASTLTLLLPSCDQKTLTHPDGT